MNKETNKHDPAPKKTKSSADNREAAHIQNARSTGRKVIFRFGSPAVGGLPTHYAISNQAFAVGTTAK